MQWKGWRPISLKKSGKQETKKPGHPGFFHGGSFMQKPPDSLKDYSLMSTA